jgi:DNA-binding transcriptional LysR family regulator
MEAKWIEDFLSLAATQSFSRSAHERNVTQSALSRRVRQLEAWLAVSLFDRSTYPIRITPEGQAFLPRAREIMDLIDTTRRELRHQSAVAGEVLTFATLNTLSITFFPTWVRRIEAHGHAFNTRFGDQRASFAGNVSLLLDGDADFLLTYAHPAVAPNIDADRFVFRHLGDEAAIPVSIPDALGRPLHPLRPNGPPTAFLSYGPCSFFGRGLAKLLADRPLPLTTVYENAMSAGLKAMALAGRGVAWLPESLIRDELRAGALVPAGDPSWMLMAEIRLYRHAARARPAVERFWSAIAAMDADAAAETTTTGRRLRLVGVG